MIYASARFKDLFLKNFRPVLFLSADFFLTQFMPHPSLRAFSYGKTNGWKRGNTKNFDREKCWEGKDFIVIFPEAKALTEFFIFPLTSEICRREKASTDGVDCQKTGVQERQGKGRDGMGKEMIETESDTGKETHETLNYMES